MDHIKTALPQKLLTGFYHFDNFVMYSMVEILHVEELL